MQPKPLPIRLLLVAIIPLLALNTGCPLLFADLFTPPPATPETARLRAFSSEAQLVQHFRDQVRAANPRGGAPTFLDFLVPLAATPPQQVDEASGDAGANDGDFTGANLQELGVDEADVVKTNGSRIFVASQGTVEIVDATDPTQLAALGEFAADGFIHDFYLLGNTVITLGFVEVASDGVPTWIERDFDIAPSIFRTQVVLRQIDVTDPAAPVLIDEVRIEGRLVTSRVTDGRLVLVTSHQPELPIAESDLNAITLNEVLPQRTVNDGPAVPAAEWSETYRAAPGEGVVTTTVSVLDAADISEVIGALTIVSQVGTVYMSTDALYLTDDAFDAANNFRPITAIHKVTFDAQGRPVYTASGSAPGRLLNQFSLDEEDGFLRIASHVTNGAFFGEPWLTDVIFFDTAIGTPTRAAVDAGAPPQPFNAVYVLEQDGADLKIVGALEDLAPGEQIYAARFMENHGFLVTFRQVDPLFVFDLSNPLAPTLLGELKIPGFSEYLHPLGAERLIGVGYNTSEGPWGPRIGGIQLSLFDVSDWSNPTVIQQLEIGDAGSFTDVSETHKAFSFSPGRNLLALPVITSFGGPAFGEGVLVYEVLPDSGFELVGGVTDADQSSFPSRWRRGLIIGEHAFAVTPEGVVAAPIDDLEQRTTRPF